MRKSQYSILADIQDAIEQAKLGKLALFWQRTIQREYYGKKVTPGEQQAYEQLQSVLSEVPQWSDEEDLRHNMENIGGRIWFCHFWIDHESMVQLTEDCNSRFHVAYVLDRDTSPEIRREAALLAQKELADCNAGMGHFASGCACPGTDEVCFSGRSCIAPCASSQRPGVHHRVKSVPPGRAACIEKCRTKGFGVLPQQAFCNAKSVFV